MAARLAAAAVMLIQPVFGWQNVARCVSGKTILDHPLFESNGTLSSYAEGLQTLVPAYGDMVEIAVSEDELNCTAAANGINGNHVLVDDAAAAYYMDVVRTKGQNKLAEEDKYYFFAFDSTHFHEYEYMATCIPGGVVGFDVLNITKGAIGAYTVVLQALMHNYGDLMYLGKSDTAAECFVPQDKLNSGNSTALQGLKKKQYNVSEVSMFGSVGTGDPNKTYLFVFTNKDWNASWGMFGQPIISGAQEDYWAQTTTKPPSARRRRTVSLFSLGSRRRKSGGKGKDDDDDKKGGNKDDDDDKKGGKNNDDDKKGGKGDKEKTDRRLKSDVFV
eukprot:TRINITY_DN22305_c0_g2_i1.p1 TRINITY_DN22305_c0_g2~~TRINITY_DN22305_c0_g2_i1.p1  ORF type:complete len:331 (-),score=81.79 TRINITY_DN22305_c0_g2_i1:123-1115(-)